MTGPDTRAWRLTHHLRLIDLCRLANISYLCLWRYETGKTRPHPVTMEALRRAMARVERGAQTNT